MLPRIWLITKHNHNSDSGFFEHFIFIAEVKDIRWYAEPYNETTRSSQLTDLCIGSLNHRAPWES